MAAQRLFHRFGWIFLGVSVLLITAWFSHPYLAAAGSQSEIGRYQISSWASYAGERVHHSGYYIIDTTTGKVVDRGHEIHGIDDPGRK